MKVLIQSITLAAFILATGIANSENSAIDEYGKEFKGIVFATCAIGLRDGRQFSEVIAVDRSDNLLPAPRKGATCSQYTAELIKAGGKVKTSDVPCQPNLDALFPVKEQRLCIAVLAAMYG